MSKPSQTKSIELTWNQLAYSIKDKTAEGGQKYILHPQSGMVKPTDLIALMGPSGSGKTSLLNCLAGRLPPTKGARFTGQLDVNGIALRSLPCPFADVSAYVEQEDVLYALSTVQETMEFTARMRLSRDTSQEERMKRIDESLKQLGLAHVKDTNVGGSSYNGAIRGLSGGERKRLSIAKELIHDPCVIFLDEPTTGLDSYQALNVMENLQGLAAGGCTVVVSIHQPRSSIFALLTGVYLLAGGRPIFVGSTDDATAYFANLGHPMPEKFNPADFYVDLVSIDQRDPKELTRTMDRLDGLVRAFEKHQAAAPQLRQSEHVDARKSILDARAGSPLGQTAFFVPLAYLITRGWREQMRDKGAIAIKIAFNIFFGLLFGLVFFQLNFDQKAIQDRMGIMAFLTMNQAFGSVITTAQVVPRQLVIVNRDRANRLYSVFPFYMSALLTSIPCELLPASLICTILYFMANLGGNFFIFLGIVLLENFVGISLGMMVSCCLKSVTMAPQIAPAVVILFLIFNGSFINEDSIPVYFGWLKELSFIRYAFKAAAVNEFQDATFTCVPGRASCIENGEQVLEQLEFNEKNMILKAVLMLAGLGCLFQVIAFVVLLFRRPRFLELQAPDTTATKVAVVPKDAETACGA